MQVSVAISEAMTLARAGRLDEAERLLRGALSRAASDPGLNRALAGVLMDAGRPREAAGCLRRVAESASLSPQAWYELGMAEAAAGRYAAAAEGLERAISLAPGAAVAYDLLGQVCLKLQQPGRALRAASLGLQIDPGNVGMAHSCVMGYKGLGMTDEAAGLAAGRRGALGHGPSDAGGVARGVRGERGPDAGAGVPGAAG
jgi:predicted Zn-dependent protease